MISPGRSDYEPDYASSPGEILAELLEERQVGKKEFANRCGLSAKHIHQVINGEASVSPCVAISFERVLGVDRQIWNNLEANYRAFKAKQAAEENAAKLTEWARSFPIKELVKRNYIEPPKNEIQAVETLFKFFGVASRKAWDAQYGAIVVSYRHSRSFVSSRESIATWLRIGEILAESVETSPYDKEKFRAALSQIRSLSSQPKDVFIFQMKELCRQAGVVVAFVREFSKTHVSAATRWLAPNKALIQMSFRHKTDDHFWFSFFHEAAHILHDRKKDIFIDDNDHDSKTERRANSFAADFLIPTKDFKTFIDNGAFDKKSILVFAQANVIPTGIVVGRLQHEKRLGFSQLNSLKTRIVLDKDC